MILDNWVFMAANTVRSKAYLQMMVKEKMLPSKCIFYVENKEEIYRELELYTPTINEHECFDVKEPLLYTIKKLGIETEVIENKDINSNKMIQCISKENAKYIIFSGYGGCILKPELFDLGKEFVHVHAGILPMYRGSTTAYFSMIQEKYIGATAIFLDKGIDEGKIIASQKFQVPSQKKDIDFIYEPYFRSCVLKKVLEMYIENGNLNGVLQEERNAQIYYIIHPVLKHLAIMGE